MTKSNPANPGAAKQSKRAARLLLAVGVLLLPLMATEAAQAQGFSVVYNFGAYAYPYSGLTVDAEGNFYGTTADQGTYGYGTVYELPAAGGEKTLYSFTGGSDGKQPIGGLLLGPNGTLFGTTQYGGDYTGPCATFGCGVLFEVNAQGKETVLYAFTGGTDGSEPVAGLVDDSSGNLYGTTLQGGVADGCSGEGCGVVFKLARNGAETVLHSFGGSPDGAYPEAALLRDAEGNLYGTTEEGGATGGACPSNLLGCGVVFKIDPSANETILHSFSGVDGELPSYSPVTRDASGNLYGTTSQGGNLSICPSAGCGVVFKLDPLGNETVLYAFTDDLDGAFPWAGVVRDGQGNLYGTTTSSTVETNGNVFKISTTGKETVLHSFDGSDGGDPVSHLLEYKGYLYGTAKGGGTLSGGVVFKLAP